MGDLGSRFTAAFSVHRKRSEAIPAVPAIAESGVPVYEALM